MDVVASGLGALEGPVTCQDGSLVVTSIDQGKLYRMAGGESRVLQVTGGGPNGATEGLDGQIYVSQHGGAAPAKNEITCAAGVQVIERSGELQQFGLDMKSPNDLCFGPDGYLYVTDPTRKPERDEGRVWRCNVETQECTLILSCDWYPNGIGFSSAPDWIYIADSRHCRICRVPIDDVSSDRVETLFHLDHGIPDGFAFDEENNLIVAAPCFEPQGGDVQVYRENKLVEVIRPGTSNLYTNVAISRDAQLYICDASRGEVLRAVWRCPGLPLYPFRT
jgi:gluconolactonase